MYLTIIKVTFKLLFLLSLIISNSNANIFKIKDLEIELFDKNKTLETKRKVIDEVAVLKINVFGEQYENKEIRSIITIVDVKTTRYSVLVKQFLDEYLFYKNNSLFKNNENKNFILINKKKSNLVSIKEFNLINYLNTSDDFPEYKKEIKKLEKKFNIKLPERVLKSDHVYMKGNGDLIWISHMFNYKTKIGNEYYEKNKQNFNPTMIGSYPELNQYMNNWIKLSLRRHDEFQNKLKIKNKLDLKYANFDLSKDLNAYKDLFNNFNNNQIIEDEKKAKLAAEKKAKEEKEKKAKEKTLKSDNELSVDDIMSKIKELNEMYKSGLISKDEFEMLKNKLLKN